MDMCDKNYRLYGNAPYKLAVIHGGPGAPGSVATIARRLVSMELGFGVIESLQTQNSVVELIEELHEIFEKNNIEKTVLLGHSWGAWLAWLYAAAYPEQVNKLILVGCGPFEPSYAPSIDQTRKSRLSAEQAAEMDAIFAALNDPGTPDEDARSRLAMLTNVDNYAPIVIPTDEEDCIETDGPALGNIFPETARMRASGELLVLSEHICCPVVAVHGDYDPHPAEGVRLPLSERLHNFHFYLLPRCGHSPWKEQYAMKAFYKIVAKELIQE